MSCVDAIHRGEITHVREEDTGAHDIVETLAGRLDNRREILENALRFGHDAPLDHLSSGRVLGHLSAEEEEPIDPDCLREWTDRRRQLRRCNCCLAHGSSSSCYGRY